MRIFVSFSLALVLSATCFAGVHPSDKQTDGRSPQITIFVLEQALQTTGIHVLRSAEREATRVFHFAGIETTWVNCRSGMDGLGCGGDGDLAIATLDIVSNSKNKAAPVGMARNGAETGTGQITIRFDLVEKASASSGVERDLILACVMAHELGHLLLGPHSHAPSGIMQPVLRNSELSRFSQGGLRFLDPQVKAMKAMLEARNVQVATKTVEPQAQGSGY